MTRSDRRPGRAPGPPAVLVADDDHQLVALLVRSLRYEGFEVDHAACGAEVLAAMAAAAPDVMVLDIGLPDLDGFRVLRELRHHSDVPVVMLSARDEVADKVSALELGADDYVSKPFAFDELVARIRAVLRRRGADALDRLTYADVAVDLGSREVRRGDHPIELTGTEFDLLVHLLRRPRKVQSRMALLRSVWGYDTAVDSNAIDVHIGHIRQKLGEPVLIRTVRGVGYLLREQP